MNTSLLLYFFISSHVWYTIRQWGNMTNPDIFIESTRKWVNIQQNMIHWNYTTRPVTPHQKESITVHEALSYWSQRQTCGHGAEFIHAGSCLPIWHSAVSYVPNERISHHFRNDIVSIFEKMMAKEASDEQLIMRQKDYESKKYIDKSDG